MFAVKLHKKKKPWLGRGSYLIPIITWETTKIQIRNWIRILNTANRNNPNNLIRYITLVKIPDSHEVALCYL